MSNGVVPAPPSHHHHGLIEWIDEHFEHGLQQDRAAPPPPQPPAAAEPASDHVTAADFRHLVADHKTSEYLKRREAHEAEARARRETVKKLVDTHISDGEWRLLIHRAREAAEAGEREFLLLRFPGQICSDGGRAVNAPDPAWPATLRGEPAEIYLRWDRDLRRGGFHIVARVLDFPDGVPGDIGLFLVWGE